jgi:hypothetical protein
MAETELANTPSFMVTQFQAAKQPFFAGASFIERNYIFGNTLAIDTLGGVIKNNTIANNIKGINIPANWIYFFGYG